MNEYGETHVTMGIMKSAIHPHVQNDPTQNLIQTTHHHVLTKKQLGQLSRVIHDDYHKLFGRVLGPINPEKHYMLTKEQLSIADAAVRELDQMRRKSSTDPRIYPPGGYATIEEEIEADSRHSLGHAAAYHFRQNVYENLGLRHDIPQPGKNFYSAEFFTDTVILWLHSFPKIDRNALEILSFLRRRRAGSMNDMIQRGLFVLGEDLMTQMFIMEMAAKTVGEWRKNNAIIDSTFFDPNDTSSDEAAYVLALNYLQNCEALAGDYYIYNTPSTDEHYKWMTSDKYLTDYVHNPRHRNDGSEDVPAYLMERDIRDPTGRIAALWRHPEYKAAAAAHGSVTDWNGHPFAADYQGYGMYDQAGQGYGVFRPTSFQDALTNYATWKADAYRKQQAVALERQQVEDRQTAIRRAAAHEQREIAWSKSDAAKGIDGTGWYDENGNLTAYIDCPDPNADPAHRHSERLVDARTGIVIGIERIQVNPQYNQYEFEPVPEDGLHEAVHLATAEGGLVAKTAGEYLILAPPMHLGRDEMEEDGSGFNLTESATPKYYEDPQYGGSDYFGPGKLRVLGKRSRADKGRCNGVTCEKVWMRQADASFTPPPEGEIVAFTRSCNGVSDGEIIIMDDRVSYDIGYELVEVWGGVGDYYSRRAGAGDLIVYTSGQDLLLPDGTVLGTLRQDDPTSPEITHDQITHYLGLPPWSSRTPSPPDTNSFGNSVGAAINTHNGDTSC